MSLVPPGSSFVFRCVYGVVFLTVFRSWRVEASSKYAHRKEQIIYKCYNESAFGITPDDGPMRPKHVVVK
jgi:hypothetical protein